MTQIRIEHVNISVSDPARTADMLIALFGWHIRWQGKAASGGHTIHVGTDTDYLAVYAMNPDPRGRAGYEKGAPLNHVGIEVGDLDAIERKVIARGLVPFSHSDYEPGRRFYFFDLDGIEYEIVSYA
jgi:glyoxylase I family protein